MNLLQCAKGRALARPFAGSKLSPAAKAATMLYPVQLPHPYPDLNFGDL